MKYRKRNRKLRYRKKRYYKKRRGGLKPDGAVYKICHMEQEAQMDTARGVAVVSFLGYSNVTANNTAMNLSTNCPEFMANMARYKQYKVIGVAFKCYTFKLGSATWDGGAQATWLMDSIMSAISNSADVLDAATANDTLRRYSTYKSGPPTMMKRYINVQKAFQPQCRGWQDTVLNTNLMNWINVIFKLQVSGVPNGTGIMNCTARVYVKFRGDRV